MEKSYEKTMEKNGKESVEEIDEACQRTVTAWSLEEKEDRKESHRVLQWSHTNSKTISHSYLLPPQ